MLNQNFVLTGEFDKSQAAFFSKLIHQRIDDDYSDFVVVEYDEIDEFIVPAKAYISYVENLTAQ